MPHLNTYLGLADHSEKILADAFRAVGEGHANVADVFHTCHTLATMSDTHRQVLANVLRRYEESSTDDVDEPERLHASGLAAVRSGEIGLLRDLQDLHVLADLTQTTWTVIAQGAQGMRDHELLQVAQQANSDNGRQIAWLNTRMKAAAPQALLVTPKRVAPSV